VIEAPFGSIREADAAYYGEGGGGATWQQIQGETSLGSGWSTASQTERSGNRTRWFVLRQYEEGVQFLNSQGEVEEFGNQPELSTVPVFDTEEDAVAAYQAWAEENGGDDQGGDESAQWSEWQQLREVEPWYLYSRTHQTEDRAQFLAAGQLQDGATVYLGPNGGVQDEAHLFESVEAVQAALQSYFQKAENGEIPEERQPTGNPPSAEDVRGGVPVDKKGPGGPLSGLVDAVGGPKIAAGLAAVGAAAVYKAQEGN